VKWIGKGAIHGGNRLPLPVAVWVTTPKRLGTAGIGAEVGGSRPDGGHRLTDATAARRCHRHFFFLLLSSSSSFLFTIRGWSIRLAQRPTSPWPPFCSRRFFSSMGRFQSKSTRIKFESTFDLVFLLAGSFFSLDRVRSYVRSGKTPQGKSFCLFQTVLFISNDVDSAQVFRFFRVFHFFLPFHATGFWSTFIKGKQSSLRLQSVIRFFFNSSNH